MKVHQLQLSPNRASKRVGRGIAAGGGKTAGRGTKGQKARTGKKIKLGFEGGQTKLSMRLPKARGFKAIRPTHFEVVKLAQLTKLSGTTVDNATLVKAGLIKNTHAQVKLLDGGELSKAYTVSVAAVSKSAKVKLEQAGGKLTSPVARPAKLTDNKKQ